MDEGDENMRKRAEEPVEPEGILDDEPAKPNYRERVTMPVGRHSKARVAGKISWRSSKVSNDYSRARSGFHHRRRKRSLE